MSEDGPMTDPRGGEGGRTWGDGQHDIDDIRWGPWQNGGQ